MTPRRHALHALAATLLVTAAFQVGRAQPAPPPPAAVSPRWAVHDANSRQAIDYGVVTQLLSNFLIEEGRGRTIVPFQRLKGEGERALATMLAGFETIPVERLNRNEQLAFWLNLRTLLVLRETVAAYPLRRPEAALSGAGELLTGKAVTISGERLSIAEIDRLLLANWPEPHLVYGLSLPVKGAPGLPRAAFTGATVHDRLNAIGRDFVNRPGTLRPRADQTEVPLFYTWHGARAGGGAELVAHLRGLAEPKLAQRLTGTAVPAARFDWALAQETSRSIDSQALENARNTGRHSGGGFGGGS